MDMDIYAIVKNATHEILWAGYVTEEEAQDRAVTLAVSHVSSGVSLLNGPDLAKHITRPPDCENCTPAPSPRVEILHSRDPDASCELAVFVDGVRIPANQVTEEDVDPGAGYLRSDWEESTQMVRDAHWYTPEFRDLVVATRDAADSTYIEED